MFSNTSREHCQSRYYKEWHPDYISAYNSLNDKNLKHFFNHPARKNHLTRNQLMTGDGKAIEEREWRKQNLEWERRRREAEMEAEFRHQREVDKRRARMCLRQKQREDDYRKKKGDKQRDVNSALKEAWTDQEQLFSKITNSNKRDIEHLLNFLNFEIKYILRPRSAPSLTKYRGTTRRLNTDLRANRRSTSARRIASASSSANFVSHGYPPVPGIRPKSLEIENRMTSPDDTVFGSGPDDHLPRGSEMIRNIEVPEREFSRSSQSVSPVRPVTAPAARSRRRNARPRSPSHQNYKEEAYLQSTVVLRYVGHTDHYTRLESRARHRAHRKSQRLPPLPAHVDEVLIEQQPRGSYVLQVFHGYLAVGDEFRFTSRRCDGYPFSLTIYVNRQCHVRLSTCCETKRTVGSRLGQGCFQLLHVQNARPCIRCVLERDPIAQKHAARIQKMRGTYDSFGNRVPPPDPDPDRGHRRRSKSSGNLLAPDHDSDSGPEEADKGEDEDGLLAPAVASPVKRRGCRKPDHHSRYEAEKKQQHEGKARPKSAPKHRPSPPTLDYPPSMNEDEGVEDFSDEDELLRLDSASDQDFAPIEAPPHNDDDDDAEPPTSPNADHKVI